MKKLHTGILLALFVAGHLSAAYAEPERMAIKETSKRAKELGAKAQLKNIDLRDIEDPAARKAIQEILNYLGLQTKK